GVCRRRRGAALPCPGVGRIRPGLPIEAFLVALLSSMIEKGGLLVMTLTMRRVLLLVSLLLLIVASPALATPVWKALGPFGGTVLSVAVDPSNSRTLYVSTGPEGVFKSLDAGLTWSKVLREYTLGALAVAPGGVIYAA